MNNRFLCIAGHINSLHVWLPLSEAFGEVWPAPSRHHDIGQQQIDGGVFLEQFSRFLDKVSALMVSLFGKRRTKI